MKKMKTLFKKDPKDLVRVINELNDGMEWVFEPETKATRKFDGTSCAIINSILYKRYDAKINKKTGKYKKPIPNGAIPCQQPDLITGHHPHWIEVDMNNPADKWHLKALDYHTENNELDKLVDGTYELIGEKVNGNKEKIKGHMLVKHGDDVLDIPGLTFEAIKEYLEMVDIEGIVFHGKDGQMCKIRQTDFGFKR